MAKINIENVVASATISDKFDLTEMIKKLSGSEYNPNRFPGLVLHIKEPKTAALVFSSGKIVCTGAKSVQEVDKAVENICDKIKKAGFKVIKPKITVQNIVASSDLNKELNLDAVAIGLGLDRIEYEPEQFPGLVYRSENPKAVILLFGSGKLVCTGAKKPEDISRAIDNLSEELTSLGV
jgi:transcription initiation factor TFIID TATA-box-binding protein